MIKVGLFSISLLLLAACGDSEPVATSYKKSMATGVGPVLPATGVPATGTADPAALAAGTTLYNNKCQGCHQPLATSLKKGATAARITAAATITQHASVAGYPTPAEAASIEAALK